MEAKGYPGRSIEVGEWSSDGIARDCPGCSNNESTNRGCAQPQPPVGTKQTVLLSLHSQIHECFVCHHFSLTQNFSVCSPWSQNVDKNDLPWNGTTFHLFGEKKSADRLCRWIPLSITSKPWKLHVVINRKLQKVDLHQAAKDPATVLARLAKFHDLRWCGCHIEIKIRSYGLTYGSKWGGKKGGIGIVGKWSEMLGQVKRKMCQSRDFQDMRNSYGFVRKTLRPQRAGNRLGWISMDFSMLLWFKQPVTVTQLRQLFSRKLTGDFHISESRQSKEKRRMWGWSVATLLCSESNNVPSRPQKPHRTLNGFAKMEGNMWKYTCLIVGGFTILGCFQVPLKTHSCWSQLWLDLSNDVFLLLSWKAFSKSPENFRLHQWEELGQDEKEAKRSSTFKGVKQLCKQTTSQALTFGL